MNRSRWLVCALIGAIVLVGIGRLERARSRHDLAQGIERVRAAIGPSLRRPGPTNFDISHFGCLLYASGKRTYALELCVDGPQNRVVEAIDRRGRTAKIYSLAGQEDAATILLPRDDTYTAWVNRLTRERKAG